MTDTPSRRQVVATIAQVGLVVGSGCLTLSPTVTMETTESAMVEQLSVTEL